MMSANVMKSIAKLGFNLQYDKIIPNKVYTRSFYGCTKKRVTE